MMDTNAVRKQGICARGHLRLVPIERTPEQLLDLDLAEEIVKLEVEEGATRPRRFYKIQEGEMHPLRVIARVIADAVKACVDPDAMFDAVMGPIRRYVERKARRRLSAPPPRPLLRA